MDIQRDHWRLQIYILSKINFAQLNNLFNGGLIIFSIACPQCHGNSMADVTFF